MGVPFELEIMTSVLGETRFYLGGLVTFSSIILFGDPHPRSGRENELSMACMVE